MRQSIKWILVILAFFLTLASVNATEWEVPTNYSTIQIAIDAIEVQSDDLIKVITGSYDITYVTKQVQIYSNNSAVTVTGFNISVDDVVIKDIKVTTGLPWRCEATSSNCYTGVYTSATNTRLTRMTIQSITGQTGILGYLTGGDAHGVYSVGSGLVVESTNISAITGGTGYSYTNPSCENGETGGNGYGVFSTQSDELRNNRVWDISGGNGGTPYCYLSAGTSCGRVGGSSGNTYVFYVDSTSELIYNNIIYDITTGTIPNSCNRYSDRTLVANDAGDIYFVYAENYVNVIENNVSDFLGGVGGQPAEGNGEGSYGKDGGDGSNIYLISADNNSYVYNNDFYDLTGGEGHDGGDGYGFAGHGGNGGSILISLSNTIQLINNRMFDLTGGEGGNGGYGSASDGNWGGDGGIGGHIKFTYGNYSAISGNTYYRFDGGLGGTGGRGSTQDGGDGGQGGDIWTHSISNDPNYIKNENLENFTGGLGGNTGIGNAVSNPIIGAGGDALGTKISYENYTTSKFTNYTINNLQYGLEGTNYYTANNNGYAGVIFPLSPSNIKPDANEETASGGTFNITWFGLVGNGNRGSSNDLEDTQGFLLYVCNSTGGNCTNFINQSQATACSNNDIICSYDWTYTAYKGKKYINITSNTTTDLNTSILSNYRVLLPYSLTVDNQAIIPSTAYRNNTLNMTWNVTNELSRTTYANITWFKNAVNWATDNQNDMTMSLTTTNTLNGSGIVASSDLAVDDSWIGQITIWDGWQSTIENTSASIIDNYWPTVPTSITCNNSDCNVSAGFNTSINLRCSGSTDSSGDSLRYFIAADFNGSLGPVTPQGYGINVSFCSGVSSGLFIPDLSYYDWETGTLTQYNVTGENVTSCLYNASCTGNCPQTLNASINLSSSDHYLYCDSTKINSTDQYSLYTINNSLVNYLFNCTMSYINATTGWLPQLSFVPG